MKKKIKQRILVAQAKQKWINTMRKLYPKFKHKLWGRHASYRSDHPQPSIK